MPVRATNNALPSGASIDLTFSPSRIPLGSSSTLDISVGAAGVGTDLYVLVGIQFQDWLRWQTSDIKMGSFLYGGVVFRSDNQLLGGNFLQIGVVVPKGDFKDVLVPVTPTRTGTFYLNEVEVVTAPVINGNFVLTPDGYSVQGITISTLQFPAKLEVYDPLQQKLLGNQDQLIDSLNIVAGAVGEARGQLDALSTALQTGLGTISNQDDRQFAMLQSQLDRQYQSTIRLSYALFGLMVVVWAYLFYLTYKLSKIAR